MVLIGVISEELMFVNCYMIVGLIEFLSLRVSRLPAFFLLFGHRFVSFLTFLVLATFLDFLTFQSFPAS